MPGTHTSRLTWLLICSLGIQGQSIWESWKQTSLTPMGHSKKRFLTVREAESPVLNTTLSPERTKNPMTILGLRFLILKMRNFGGRWNWALRLRREQKENLSELRPRAVGEQEEAKLCQSHQLRALMTALPVPPFFIWTVTTLIDVPHRVSFERSVDEILIYSFV